MKLEDLENKMIDSKTSMMSLQIVNHVNNQLILKILSDKFDINLKDYTKYEKIWQEEAFDLLSIRNE